MNIVYAALVTVENVADIIDRAAAFNLNVDYLPDTLAFYTENGEELYAILSINKNDYSQATFTEVSGAEYNRFWTVKDKAPVPHFNEVVTKTEAR